MKRVSLTFMPLALSTCLLAPAFAQFRDPIGPYNAPDQDTRGVQERGVQAGEDTQAAPPTMQEKPAGTAPEGDVQERGLLDKFKSKDLKQLQPTTSPPARLCHTETVQMTQCKCFNQTECQALTALFPNSCPAGSTHCEFIPMARGTMPPLPQNLCHYQVPLTVTECSCSNTADCQLLSPFCPGSCPAGSTSCTCRPMRRGR